MYEGVNEIYNGGYHGVVIEQPLGGTIPQRPPVVRRLTWSLTVEADTVEESPEEIAKSINTINESLARGELAVEQVD